ncbi:MAG TPA: hypothetical protein VE546_14695 [Streptomyces sp.]|uniref:hypothetical protein n=1 Tax=Streptomyces sp. TaxID=1931 RepID=UPI002D4A109E|nr:hypothetical protein [Streptomyces sp.]HZG04797.1 hypothetical protein [Streptomyces sp.]
MRNAVKCTLAGGGLLVAGALGPLCGAALAAPQATAPSALVLTEAPERTVTLVCHAGAPDARSAPELVCVTVDGGGATACPVPGGPVPRMPVVVTAGSGAEGVCAEPSGGPGSGEAPGF